MLPFFFLVLATPRPILSTMSATLLESVPGGSTLPSAAAAISAYFLEDAI
jgi:hypothetical protein